MGHKEKRKRERKRARTVQFQEKLHSDMTLVKERLEEPRFLENRFIDLAAFQEFVVGIDHYPISRSQVLDVAHQRDVPNNVISFFESIPVEVTFYNREEILTRAEEEELLLEEEAEQVDERLHSYDD